MVDSSPPRPQPYSPEELVGIIEWLASGVTAHHDTLRRVAATLRALRQDRETLLKLATEAVSDLRDFCEWRKEYVWENACAHSNVEEFDRSCKSCGAIIPESDEEEIICGRPWFVKPLNYYEHHLAAARSGSPDTPTTNPSPISNTLVVGPDTEGNV